MNWQIVTHNIRCLSVVSLLDDELILMLIRYSNETWMNFVLFSAVVSELNLAAPTVVGYVIIVSNSRRSLAHFPSTCGCYSRWIVIFSSENWNSIWISNKTQYHKSTRKFPENVKNCFQLFFQHPRRARWASKSAELSVSYAVDWAADELPRGTSTTNKL